MLSSERHKTAIRALIALLAGAVGFAASRLLGADPAAPTATMGSGVEVVTNAGSGAIASGLVVWVLMSRLQDSIGALKEKIASLEEKILSVAREQSERIPRFEAHLEKLEERIEAIERDGCYAFRDRHPRRPGDPPDSDFTPERK